MCHSVSAYMYYYYGGMYVPCVCMHVCMCYCGGHVCATVWVLKCMYVLLRGTCVFHSVSACMQVCVIVGAAYVCHSTYMGIRGQLCGICSFMGSMDWIPGFEVSSLYPLSHLDGSNLLLF